MRSLTFVTLVALAAATPALAQEMRPTTPSTTAPAATAPAPDRSGMTGSVDAKPGANSFTEAQARSRAEAAGFSGIQALAKDEQGIWRGKANRDGKQVTVAVDFKGDVSAN